MLSWIGVYKTFCRDFDRNISVNQILKATSVHTLNKLCLSKLFCKCYGRKSVFAECCLIFFSLIAYIMMEFG